MQPSAQVVSEHDERDGLILVVNGAAPSARLLVAGEVDLCTAPRLARCLAGLRDSGYRTIDLDLSGLAFLGAAGLAVFSEAVADLQAVGGRLRLVAVTPHVRRLVELGGLDTVLVVPDAEPAVRRGRGRSGCPRR